MATENSMDRSFSPDFWDKLPLSRDFQVTLAFSPFSRSSFLDLGPVCPKKSLWNSLNISRLSVPPSAAPGDFWKGGTHLGI